MKKLTLKGVFHFCLLTLFLLSIPSLQAAETLMLSENMNHVALGKYSDYLEDSTNKWTIDDVQTDKIAQYFRLNTTDYPNFSVTKSSYWLRFKIKNSSDSSRQLKFLLKTYYDFFEIHVFSENGDYDSSIKNLNQLIQAKKSRWDFFTSVLNLEANESKEIYVKISAPFSLNVDLSVADAEQVNTLLINEIEFFVFVWGVVLLISLLSMLFYFYSRDKTYLYFSLFVLFLIIPRMIINGWKIVFISPIASWNTTLLLLSIYLSLIFAIRFFVKVFETEKRIPRQHWLAMQWWKLNVAGLILPFVVGTHFNILYLFFTLTPFFYFIPYAFYHYWNSDIHFVRYYLTAGPGFFIFIVFHVLINMGWIDTPFFGLYFIEMGLLYLTIVLTIALAKNLQLLYQEKLNTQRQAINNLHLVDEFKNKLLANTSHELRTPLHGIIGLLETLLSSTQETFTNETRRRLQLVVDNGKRLNRLVDNLLEFSIIQKQGVILHKEPVYLFPLAQSVQQLSLPFVKEKSLEIINEIPPDMSPVFADPNSLQQILLNLINNACKYTEAGYVTISAIEKNDKVTIMVADTGIGMTNEELEKIFDSFQRGKEQQISQKEGMGLGLSINKELLTAHGSDLKVQSTIGKGSTFSFSLPIDGNIQNITNINETFEMVAPVIDLKQEISDSEISVNVNNFHVLIVDDDHTNLEIITDYLIKHYKITICNNGQEALNVVESDPEISMILLDVMMPNMDGFEVCELIREKYTPEQLPILMLTALSSEEDITQGYEVGANDYITKPFRRAELLARIATHLKLSDAFNKASNLDDSQESREDLLRIELTKTLQFSLAVWESQTGKSALELVQESKLWGLYFDQLSSSWRYRSFTNYLSMNTLPKKPRWRKVLQTAQFVLLHCKEGSEHEKQLNAQLFELNRHLDDHPST